MERLPSGEFTVRLSEARRLAPDQAAMNMTSMTQPIEYLSDTSLLSQAETIRLGRTPKYEVKDNL